MSRFIHALGIRNVGEHLSKILASVYDGDMDMLINSDYESLIAIDECHCVSTWSDFRSNYKELYLIKKWILKY